MGGRQLLANLDSLAEIRGFLKEAAAAAGIEDSRAYQLQLAVDEIATNIILYGYRGADEGASISISAEMTADALVVILRDQSPPFDPRTTDLPETDDLARPLEQRKIGGLGIFLAFQGVDRFEYRHEDGVNSSIFEVRRRHD